MLEALAEATVNWLSNGLPLDSIKIVCHENAMSPTLQAAFARAKDRATISASSSGSSSFRYDLFISYCHKDSEPVDRLVNSFLETRPSLRIFMDRLELKPGAAWQQHIFEAIDEAHRVVCVLSPNYLESKICKEEFNIALLRHRNSASGVLLPIYLNTAQLPSYMELIQYHDAREADDQKLLAAARLMVQQASG